ncbi:MAG: ABC transporter permease [Acidobacteriaceae bacterium]
MAGHGALFAGAQRTWQLLRLSIRNFRRFRLQMALILAATITGTSGVMLSTGYAAGGRQKILDQFTRLGANVIIITPQQSRSVGGRARTGSLVTTLKSADYNIIRQAVNGIAASSATVGTTLRIRAGDLTKNTFIVGCEPDYFVIQHWRAVEGASFDEGAERRQARVAMLGATAARDLFGDGDPTGERISINRVPFTVIGVLAERGQGLDATNQDDQVYVPLSAAMRRLMNVDFYNSIVVEIAASSQMDAAATQLTALLELRHRRLTQGAPDFQVQSRKALIDAQFASFARLTFLLRWIALSALEVSSLGLFAVTWIGAKNRSREIGMRRAIGATRRDILLQFFTEGMAGGLLGVVLGSVLGNIALRMIDARTHQPFVFSLEAALAEALLLVLLYALFTLGASLRSIRVQPLVALRAE